MIAVGTGARVDRLLVGRRTGFWPRACGAASFVAVVAVASASGGYFPQSWSWTTISLAWLATIAMALRGLQRWTRVQLALLVGMLAASAWMALSILWSPDLTATSIEPQRTLVYGALVLAVLVVVRAGEHVPVTAGVTVAIMTVCAYSLATRLFPDRLGYYDPTADYRLSAPLGYWNALGMVAAVGLLLTFGLLAESRRRHVSALMGGGLVVLMCTLYFSFSRGGWMALFVGTAALFSIAPSRWRLLVKAVPPALIAVGAVLLCSRNPGLTHQGADVAAAASDGHRLALLLGLLFLIAAGAAVLAARGADRVSHSHRLREAVTGVAIAAVALTTAIALVQAGGPIRIAEQAYDSFRGPPLLNPPGTNLNDRLLSFSSNGRLDLWDVARKEFVSHPLIGDGAGSFTLYWSEHRPTERRVLDAHSLYLESAAELGVIGLLLLVGTLVVPLTAVRRLRRVPMGAAALAVWAAFLFHAGVDWDWEMPVVGVTALIVMGAALSALRDPEAEPRTGLRYAGLGLGALLIGLGLFFLPGNLELAKAQSANDQHRYTAAERFARRAESFAPWSSQPPFQRALALDGLGRRAEARRSALVAVSRSPRDWRAWALLARVSSGARRGVALAHVHVLNPLIRPADAMEEVAE